MTAVETLGLTKRYGDFVALDQCSLAVEEGEVFGLLGPNGAGKTTLLRLLLGFLKPSSGSAKVCGFDVHTRSVDVRKQVSYLPGDARLSGQMRCRSILRFFADLHPQGDFNRSIAIADELELDLRRRVGMMSTGMRQKLALCVVLSTTAPLLILDEPTANLDPTVRMVVLNHILAARDSGRTVIFSSHVLSEIQKVCSRVVFLKHGKLVREQIMSDLKDRHRIFLRLSDGKLPEIPESIKPHVLSVSQTGETVILETDKNLAPLLAWLGTVDPADVRLEPLGIDAIYDQVHGQISPPGEVSDD